LDVARAGQIGKRPLDGAITALATMIEVDVTDRIAEGAPPEREAR
jgi:hypothetical protein